MTVRHPEKAPRPDTPIRRKPDWIRKHAAFMILGAICTRGCGLCNVRKTFSECQQTIDKFDFRVIISF